MACACKNIGMGTYKRQVLMVDPFTGKTVGIDVCICKQIAELWYTGIKTMASCCGHGKTYPSVIVASWLSPTMVAAGYRQGEIEDEFILEGAERMSIIDEVTRLVKERDEYKRLCGHILATIRVNFYRGTLRVEDGHEDLLEQILADWKKQIDRIQGGSDGKISRNKMQLGVRCPHGRIPEW